MIVISDFGLRITDCLPTGLLASGPALPLALVWNPWLLGILAVANLPIYYFLWKTFFGCWEDFAECVRFWLTPDLLSMFRGEYEQDWWSELKLFGWIISCLGAVGLEYWAIAKWLL